MDAQGIAPKSTPKSTLGQESQENMKQERETPSKR